MIDFDETDEDKRRIRESVSARQNSYKNFKIKQKYMACFFFLVPAIIPFCFTNLSVPNDTAFYQLLLSNINILFHSNTVLGDSVYYRVVFWGYAFSIIYLISISPYIYFYLRKAQRTGFSKVDNKQKIHLVWFLLFSVLIFLTTLLFDMPETGSKLWKLFVASCYVWPLFYAHFIMPLYLSVFLLFYFYVHKSEPMRSLYEDEYYSEYRKTTNKLINKD